MKYTYMMRLSVLAVLLILGAQSVLVYRLFRTDVALLQRELNLITQSVYNMELSARLGAKKSGDTPDIKFFGTTPPPGIDTTKITHIDARGLDKNKDQGLASAMNIAMEEFVAQSKPVNLRRIDSIADTFFKKENIKLKFFSEIIDVSADSNKVLETTWCDSDTTRTIHSTGIPLNVKQTKMLRLVLINPMWDVYPQMGWMLLASLLLSIFCIYTLYQQKKVMSRQKEVVRMKNEFFSQVSHEFKRPLAVLYQSLDSLQNDDVLNDEKKRNHVVKVSRQQVITVVAKNEMFLSLAMNEQGVLRMYRTEFDLSKLVFDLTDSVIEVESGSCEIDVDNELKNPIIFADEVHIEQVISNLIGNALKYSKDFANIHVKLYVEDSNVCISVEDEGVGIAPEHLEIIFERYVRVVESGHVRGHGIGLHYVKLIVEMHGGTISVESKLNVGSKFTIKLPMVITPRS